MKFLAFLSVLLFSPLLAPAAILIFDGPAPLNTYGTEFSVRKNRAVLVYDTTSGQIGIINYFGGRGRGPGDQLFLGPITVEGGVVSLKRGSITVLSGVAQTTSDTGNFDTKMVSFRGRNSLLNRRTGLRGPRAVSGIARLTNRTGTLLVHWEQSFSLAYRAKFSDAANLANDTFEAALDRMSLDLQNRGFASQDR